ncbi:BZ3500_MvSof-1268-A1-R1_Chr11-2g03412 [Microbotryum saponariae]|uniref:BZ3500_MvSof-1268-A1-R1_Chr11-2g03412 protein n=1 Tax=Microbotryum saponariae TaxID=289078 RepID=A0A2X0MS32_9BASI|nr:BZ3500_MvSof-1268-A1-R1_Chr11-2g03412 [Microbotryum saponariae]SDA03322.1 BZ3501_MvSof-1269-A2-R1_Chr11g02983 [Microbotryum saponariae]
MVYELVFNEMDNFDGDSSDSGSEYMSIDDSIQRAKHITMLKHGKRLPPWLFFKQMQTVWWRKAEPRLNRAGSYRKFDSYYNLIKRDKDLYKSCLEAFNVTGGSRPDEETREDDDRPSRGELLADQANQALLKFYTSEWFSYWEESPVKDTEHLTRDFALTELGGVVPKNTRKRAKPQSCTDEDDDEEALQDKETLAAEEAEDEDTRRKVIKGKGRARAKPQSSANNEDPVFNGFIKTITDIEKGRFQNETVVAEHAAAKAKIDADEAKVKAKDARFEVIKRWTERLQAFKDEGDVEREAIARARLNRLNDELLDEDD